MLRKWILSPGRSHLRSCNLCEGSLKIGLKVCRETVMCFKVSNSMTTREKQKCSP